METSQGEHEALLAQFPAPPSTVAPKPPGMPASPPDPRRPDGKLHGVQTVAEWLEAQVRRAAGCTAAC